MTQTQMEYFKKVYDVGNIAKVADELFVSRSVISRAILSMEQEFGKTLFSRSKSGVVPTEAGHQVYQMLKNLLTTYEISCERIRRLNETDEATQFIRLGVVPTNIDKVYHELCEPFSRAYPDIEVSLVEHPAIDLCNILRRNDVDLAITPGHPSNISSLTGMDVFVTRMSLCMATNLPLAQRENLDVSDLLELPLAFMNVPTPMEHTLVEYCKSCGKQMNVRLRTSSMSLLREMTQKGQVYSLIPDHIARRWENTKVTSLAFFPSTVHKLFWNSLMMPSPAMTKFIEYVQTHPLT